jgi:hypothetical protein
MRNPGILVVVAVVEGHTLHGLLQAHEGRREATAELEIGTPRK